MKTPTLLPMHFIIDKPILILNALSKAMEILLSLKLGTSIIFVSANYFNILKDLYLIKNSIIRHIRYQKDIIVISL